MLEVDGAGEGVGFMQAQEGSAVRDILAQRATVEAPALGFGAGALPWPDERFYAKTRGGSLVR